MKKPSIGFKEVPGPHSLGPFSPRFAWDGKPARPPRKGEHFLSGAIVEAHLATSDMSTPYFIAKRVG